MLVLLAVATGANFLGVWLLKYEAKPNKTYTFIYLYMIPFWIDVFMLVYLLTVARALNVETLQKAEAFKDYSIVNGCSDDFTEIPAQRVVAELENARIEVKTTM